MGVFYYDGRAPVNVVAALGVFVLVQLVLLLLAVVAALPRGWVGWLPGTEGVQEALRLTSPGRLALLAARFLPQDLRDALSAAIGRSGAHQRVYGRVQLWAILRWSQLYALALNIAAVTTFLYLVFFSDLAFGWSTTLDIEPARFHQLVHGVALPWSWEPTLTPSLALVEQSRYFRGTPFDPTYRGAWWPFVLTAMLVYGLLPRIIAFLFASRMLRGASTLAMRSMPGAVELLAQLREAPPAALEKKHEQQAAQETELVVSPGRRPYVIDWSRAAGSSERSAQLLGIEPIGYQPAGGSRLVEEDRQVVQAVGSEVTEDGVVLLVKLWEPPVIETTEFLRDTRLAIGDRLPINVVPVACDPTGQVISDDPVLVEQWQQRIAATGDPWTRVAQPVGFSLPEKEASDE